MSTSIRLRLAAHFPAFGLEIRTPRLTLRYPDDGDALALAALASLGVHDDDVMPFLVPWTRVPQPFLQRNTLQHLWTQRITMQQDTWSLPLVVVVDGEVAGLQDIGATNWSVTRTVGTGSWLGRAFQGQGIGREMRTAVLHLAFDGFDAVRATTSAWEENAASLGVTRALGYRPNGDAWSDRGGERTREVHFAMERDGFAAVRRADVEVVGAAAVAALFGTEQRPGA